MKMPCKGCGQPVEVEGAEYDLERIGALSRGGHIDVTAWHPECKPAVEGPPLRKLRVEVKVSIDGEEAAGYAVDIEAESFAKGASALSDRLGEQWERIVDAASLVDEAIAPKGGGEG